MKWLVFLSSLLVFAPLLGIFAAKEARARRWLLGIAGFSVFHRVNIGLFSQAYRGEASEFEFTLLDIVIVALFLGQLLRGARGARARGRLPFAAPRWAYMAIVLLSVFLSPSMVLSSYSAWNLARMYCLFAVLSVELSQLADVRAALYGLGLGVLTQGALALEQHYVTGAARVVGSLPHPNSLSMLVNLITPISLSLFLAGQRRWVHGAIVASGAIAVLLSLSRGGIMMFATSAMIVIVGSFAKGFRLKKVAAVGALSAGALVLLAKSMNALADRFNNAPKSSEQARVLFNRAAAAMADDHPLGIGLNMFSQTLDLGGYADRFALATRDRDGIAHNIYWLTAAELGYLGLAAYLALLFAVLFVAIRTALARGIRGDIALGITAGLTAMYIQGTAEWIARQPQMSYGFWMIAAILGALRAIPATRPSGSLRTPPPPPLRTPQTLPGTA